MTPNTSFAELLASAATGPGILSAAYQQSRNYSLGNQLLTWSQCLAPTIQPVLTATFDDTERGQ